MFDCNSFLRRMGWSQKDLAKRVSKGTSTVGMWCTGSSCPPYEVIEKLIHLGIIPKELFGDEIDEIFLNYYRSQNLIPNINDPGFMKGLDAAADPESALNARVERMVLQMKAKGLI